MLTIRHIAYGLIVFLIVIGAGIGYMAQSKITSYSDNPSEYYRFNESFNKINEVSSQASSWNRTLSGKAVNQGTFGALNDLINTGWTFLKSGWTSISSVGSVLSGTSAMFGVPPFIVTLLISAILTLIVFTILSAIFLRDI